MSSPFAILRFSSFALLLIAGLANAEPVTLKVIPGKPNYVQFTSVAPLETVVGHTDRISGTVLVDPENLTGNISAALTVEMGSLTTDNRIRDGHMRDHHLETGKFPTCQFVIKTLGSEAPKKLESGKPETFTIKGEFTCHGVTKDIQPTVTTIWNPDEKSLNVIATFEVLLADYSIPRPQFLVMKLDEKQSVTVKFTAQRE